ncbi:uncharacterized protein LOC111370722 [Olea europaea var. sylvestris]|uniref:uncharacterized protein LOC111370722 n=1 Tax=Olea europaea var. sylvestris TaxID=158386 RepID=UPI000C1CCEE1|nr:uncharacterized protein LOC111370722 [Olea europaea var. sylvestris]
MSKQYWTPTSAQLQVLESIFNQENKTLNKLRIMQIVSELSLHGEISDMNVYNWFKSKRARLRRLNLSTQSHDSELVIQPRVQKDKLYKRHIDSIDQYVELQKDLHVDESIDMKKQFENDNMQSQCGSHVPIILDRSKKIDIQNIPVEPYILPSLIDYKISDRLSESTLKKLIDILKINPYCRFFRSLSEVSDFDSCCIVLRSDPDLDRRVYNMSSCEQVAAVWVDENPSASIKTRDKLIYGHSNIAHRVNYYYNCYDPLQYQLIFTYGEPGWHEGIEKFFNLFRVHKCILISRSVFVTLSFFPFSYEERQTSTIIYNGYAWFIGGLRNLTKRYMNAMCLVQRYGKLDVFLTMTCNPNWPEIKQELRHNDSIQNMPNLLALIFRAKFEELKIDLIKREILGSIAAYVYVIEFQKRGLPHVHFLLIFKTNFKITNSMQVDEIVSCEILDPKRNPHLHATVVKHMMHGHCGQLNPTNMCMKNNHTCKNKYSREYILHTSLGSDSYPLYRRRDDGVTVRTNIYTNMYTKGHDRVNFTVNKETNEHYVDEISNYQTARWISAPEAIWRIFSFDLFDISPSVVSLQLHIENTQLVMHMARTLLYKDFPTYFVWNIYFRVWSPRKKQNVIGRIVAANPSEDERYFLKVLLNHVKGPKSFQDLRTVNNIVVPTYREATFFHGLIGGNNYCEMCLNEAITYEMPISLRRLFPNVLIFCNPANSRNLWVKFIVYMIEDILHASMTVGDAEIRVLRCINSFLEVFGTNINDFGLLDFDVIVNDADVLANMILEETTNINVQCDMHFTENLNKEQQSAHDVILDCVVNNKNGVFFIDGLGGIGKTFLYKALLALVRSRQLITLATASLGVAASLLPAGLKEDIFSANPSCFKENNIELYKGKIIIFKHVLHNIPCSTYLYLFGTYRDEESIRYYRYLPQSFVYIYSSYPTKLI